MSEAPSLPRGEIVASAGDATARSMGVLEAGGCVVEAKSGGAVCSGQATATAVVKRSKRGNRGGVGRTPGSTAPPKTTAEAGGAGTRNATSSVVSRVQGHGGKSTPTADASPCVHKTVVVRRSKVATATSLADLRAMRNAITGIDAAEEQAIEELSKLLLMRCHQVPRSAGGVSVDSAARSDATGSGVRLAVSAEGGPVASAAVASVPRTAWPTLGSTSSDASGSKAACSAAEAAQPRTQGATYRDVLSIGPVKAEQPMPDATPVAPAPFTSSLSPLAPSFVPQPRGDAAAFAVEEPLMRFLRKLTQSDKDKAKNMEILLNMLEGRSKASLRGGPPPPVATSTGSPSPSPSVGVAPVVEEAVASPLPAAAADQGAAGASLGRPIRGPLSPFAYRTRCAHPMLYPAQPYGCVSPLAIPQRFMGALADLLPPLPTPESFAEIYYTQQQQQRPHAPPEESSQPQPVPEPSLPGGAPGVSPTTTSQPACPQDRAHGREVAGASGAEATPSATLATNHKGSGFTRFPARSALDASTRVTKFLPQVSPDRRGSTNAPDAGGIGTRAAGPAGSPLKKKTEWKRESNLLWYRNASTAPAPEPSAPPAAAAAAAHDREVVLSKPDVPVAVAGSSDPGVLAGSVKAAPWAASGTSDAKVPSQSGAPVVGALGTPSRAKAGAGRQSPAPLMSVVADEPFARDESPRTPRELVFGAYDGPGDTCIVTITPQERAILSTVQRDFAVKMRGAGGCNRDTPQRLFDDTPQTRAAATAAGETGEKQGGVRLSQASTHSHGSSSNAWAIMPSFTSPLGRRSVSSNTSPNTGSTPGSRKLSSGQRRAPEDEDSLQPPRQLVVSEAEGTTPAAEQRAEPAGVAANTVLRREWKRHPTEWSVGRAAFGSAIATTTGNINTTYFSYHPPSATPASATEATPGTNTMDPTPADTTLTVAPTSTNEPEPRASPVPATEPKTTLNLEAKPFVPSMGTTVEELARSGNHSYFPPQSEESKGHLSFATPSPETYLQWKLWMEEYWTTMAMTCSHDFHHGGMPPLLPPQGPVSIEVGRNGCLGVHTTSNAPSPTARDGPL